MRYYSMGYGLGYIVKIKTDNYSIFQRNCIDVMTDMDSQSIDAIITSPPYKNKEGFSYDLICKFIEKSDRIIKDDGILMVNFGQLAEDPQRHHKIAILIGEKFKPGPEIAWVKAHHKLGGQFTPLRGSWWVNRKHEYIYVFGKSNSKLDRLSVGIPYKWKGNKYRWTHGRDTQCRGDVWYIPYETKGHSFKKGERKVNHPYQWPIDLPKMLIKLSGKREGTIMDPFMGSGSTGIAAIELGAKFIGCEMDSNHFTLANLNLAQTCQQFP